MIRLISRCGLALLAALVPTAVVGQTSPTPARCVPLMRPLQLPSVSQLLDSSAALAVLRSDSSFVGAHAALAVAIDSSGTLRELRALSSDLSVATTRRLALAIGSFIEAHAPDLPWHLHVLVQLADAPQIMLERSEYCRPVLREDGTVSRVERLDGHRVVAPARWLVHIDTSGRVREATIVQRTPYHDLEGQTQRELRRLAFVPATIDGTPVEVTDTVSYSVAGFVR